jgi:hypothetical protein
LEIILFFLLSAEFRSESSHRHIGDGEKMGKGDAGVPSQFSSVVFFKGELGRGQKGTSGIVDKVKGEIRIGPVSQGVQTPNRFDAFLVDSFATLGPNILLKIAGQRGNEPNPVLPEKLRHSLQSWLEEYGQVCPDLDLMALPAKGQDKTGEVGIELWRSARQIDKLARRNLGSF